MAVIPDWLGSTAIWRRYHGVFFKGRESSEDITWRVILMNKKGLKESWWGTSAGWEVKKTLHLINYKYCGVGRVGQPFLKSL
jgi:hypothetical protein